MTPLDDNTLRLIQKHTRGLSEDASQNQLHHLRLLEALVKVGLDEIGVNDHPNRKSET